MLTKQDETTVKKIVEEGIESSPRINSMQKDINRALVLLESQDDRWKIISENLELTSVDRRNAKDLEKRVDDLELDVRVLKHAK